jgi:hypothetical protein
VIIQTLWLWYKGADGPDLIEAWDEYGIDNNPEGWQEACEKALASVGDDLRAHRFIRLTVDYEKIEQAFLDVEVKAEVHDL